MAERMTLAGPGTYNKWPERLLKQLKSLQNFTELTEPLTDLDGYLVRTRRVK